MGNNVGLDFGTTYSVIATANNPQKDDYSPTAAKVIQGDDNTIFHDSMALRDRDGEWYYGVAARNMLKEAQISTYKGFKLLLAEAPQSLLSQPGYGDGTQPSVLVKNYIQEHLNQYIERYGAIDKLVIGVPNVWDEDGKSHACYDILYDIAEKAKWAGEIELITEPVAAGAYYTEKYKTLNDGKAFEGKILIVDYGGGTLDIALCDSKLVDGIPIITVIKSVGAGGNETGKLGDAGLSFMEGVARLALKKAGLSDEEIDGDENKPYFDSFVIDIEKYFTQTLPKAKNKFKTFKETFRNGVNKRLFSNTWCLTSFSTVTMMIGGSKRHLDDVEVQIGMVAQAFKERTEPILDKKLGEIIAYMDAEKEDDGSKKEVIKWRIGAEHFKIQLIGGFCNFFLVENYINERLQKSSSNDADIRYVGELNSEERTMAVAFGAYLRADSQVDSGINSQYSLYLPQLQLCRTLRTKYGAGADKHIPDPIVRLEQEMRPQIRERSMYAFQTGMELIPNRVYLFKHKNGNPGPVIIEAVTMLIYDGPYNPMLLMIKDQFSKSLRFEVDYANGYILGISRNRSGILTFHHWKVDNPEKMGQYLDRMEDMLAAGDPVPGLTEGPSVRLDKVLKLSGDEGAIPLM